MPGCVWVPQGSPVLSPWRVSGGASVPCPPCPSLGFSPMGRARGEVMLPPRLLMLPGGQGFITTRRSQPPPVASGCHASAPTPSHHPGLFVPLPHVPPGPGAWAESCSAAQSHGTGLLIHGATASAGWAQRCQQPQGSGLCPLPPLCSSCPQSWLSPV